MNVILMYKMICEKKMSNKKYSFILHEKLLSKYLRLKMYRVLMQVDHQCTSVKLAN